MPPWEDGSSPNRGFQLVDDGHRRRIRRHLFARRDRRPRPRRVQPRCVLRTARVSTRQCAAHPIAAGATRVRLHRFLTERKRRRHERAPGFPAPRTAGRLVVNLPAASLPGPGHRRSGRPGRRLRGRDADAFRDHRDAAAARHVLVETMRPMRISSIAGNGGRDCPGSPYRCTSGRPRSAADRMAARRRPSPATRYYRSPWPSGA